MADQLIANHVIGDRKCMEKRNTVDRRSILKNRTLVVWIKLWQGLGTNYAED